MYTGNGKGKTTAAIGLAVRAAGAGLNVLFAQFVKGVKYSEIGALERFSDRITIRQYGRECFIKRKAEPEDAVVASKGLEEIMRFLEEKKYDVVILDEANIALHYSLFSVRELLDVVGKRAPSCEIVITGRYAPQELLDAADLVTEMKEIKHYYGNGVEARAGIER
ncbi:MAG: cob(I)yrinic acid a,c-diamide adenosyltransferase [Chitinispirillaceae bacterium]|nr:cob(I)yrinic acid a,c-diamide adenosyltransferase [Chitinispirillaceae bacterium]